MVGMEGRNAVTIYIYSKNQTYFLRRYSPCKSPLHLRSSSSLSVNSLDLDNLHVEEKLQEMELLIKEQKEIINKQKTVIADQTDEIEKLETVVKKDNRANECEVLEDID